MYVGYVNIQCVSILREIHNYLCVKIEGINFFECIIYSQYKHIALEKMLLQHSFQKNSMHLKLPDTNIPLLSSVMVEISIPICF